MFALPSMLGMGGMPLMMNGGAPQGGVGAGREEGAGYRRLQASIAAVKQENKVAPLPPISKIRGALGMGWDMVQKGIRSYAPPGRGPAHRGW